MTTIAHQPPRFDIEPIPLLRLFVATDAQMRLRLSADMIRLFNIDAGQRVELGYDAAARAIAIRQAGNPNDPQAANVDKRGYISARRFYDRTQIPAVARRYEFEGEQDGWLVFLAEED